MGNVSVVRRMERRESGESVGSDEDGLTRTMNVGGIED